MRVASLFSCVYVDVMTVTEEALEQWKPVPGWEGLYEISDRGRLRSLDRWVSPKGCRPYLMRGKLFPGTNRDSYGYPIVCLVNSPRRQTATIHKLVLIAFRGTRPPDTQARHLDGNKENNALDNLVWGTVQANHDDKKRHGTMARGQKINRAKLSDEIVMDIRVRSAAGESRMALAREFGICDETIRHIIKRKTWTHVGGPPVTPRKMQAKFTRDEVIEIRRRLANGDSEQTISKAVGRPWKSINLIKRGVAYRDIS
jgi:hypothetical protein